MTKRAWMNDARIDDLVRQMLISVRADDERFRATHVGLAVDVLIADFAAFRPKLVLPEGALQAYAEAVSAGMPLEWQLAP